MEHPKFIEMLQDHSFFDKPKDPENFICLIVLNQPVKATLFFSLFEIADYKIYADGGSQSVQNIVGSKYLDEYKPDAALGDFDSLDEKNKKELESHGVKIIWTPDQDYTDCEKALIYLEENIFTDPKLKSKSIKVLIVGAFGGRMDHTLQNMSILWKKSLSPHQTFYELFMLDNLNKMTVIKPGKTRVIVSRKLDNKKGCGIIPFTKCSEITTDGLKWNLGIFIYYIKNKFTKQRSKIYL